VPEGYNLFPLYLSIESGKMDSYGPEIVLLAKKAVEAMSFAYNPYSKFSVGAALLCADGTIYTGCNVENVSYGLCICAERTALVKAVSEGRRHFKAIAVTTSLKDETGSPCGACRQFMVEFGPFDVYMVTPSLNKCNKWTTEELLPHYFDKDSLRRAGTMQ